jgi:hypothetical protein
MLTMPCEAVAHVYFGPPATDLCRSRNVRFYLKCDIGFTT